MDFLIFLFSCRACVPNRIVRLVSRKLSSPPFLSRVRMVDVAIRKRTCLSNALLYRRTCCKLGSKVRRVLLCACETLLPRMTRFAVSVHIFVIGFYFMSSRMMFL